MFNFSVVFYDCSSAGHKGQWLNHNSMTTMVPLNHRIGNRAHADGRNSTGKVQINLSLRPPEK